MEDDRDPLDEAYRIGDIVDGRVPAGDAAAESSESDADATEAPYEFEDLLPESPYSGVLAESCSAIVQEVADVERSQAQLKAWQVERIDEARRLAEATEHGVLTVGSTLSATQRREMARRSLVAELACALRMPETTVTGMVTDAQALVHRLPATLDALRDGAISYRHARVLVDQSHTLSADAALALEEQSLPFAKTLTVATFTVKARLLREHLDPGAIADRVAKSAKDRRLEFQPAPDGMAWLNLYTTAPEANSLFTAVRDQAIRLQKNPADPRTLTQLTADVCTDALSAALTGDLPAGSADPGTVPSEALAAGSAIGADPAAAFNRIQPTVLVTIPALTLLGWGEEPGTLDGYGPIDPRTARLLAGQSTTWYRMLTDPKTGAPIAVDSKKYRPSRAMRRHLAFVDGTCRFTGCNRAARHCDLDHTKDHQFGGPTQCENLSHLCPKHHRLKHQTTWQARQLGAGTLEWTSPGGKTYVTHPEIRLATPDATPPRQPPPKAPPPQESRQRLSEPPPF